jgi:hypothetical protein
MGIKNNILDTEIWDQSGNTLSLTMGNLTSGVWTHVGMSYRGDGYLINYINGQAVDSLPATGLPLGESSNKLTLACAPWDLNALFFSGSLDDVNIYDRKLSNLEMKALFETITSRHPLVQEQGPFVLGNPLVGERLQIRFPESQNEIREVNLFDPFGKEVLTISNLNQAEENINLAGLGAGIYLLKIRAKNKIFCQKILKP